jgi:hypothetical protein
MLLRTLLVLLLAFAAAAVGTRSAWAREDPCDAVLKVAAVDIFIKDDAKSTVSTFLRMLQSREASSYEEAKRFALDAKVALPIEGIPVDFRTGARRDSTGKGTWATELYEHIAKTEGASERFYQETRKVNQSAVDAWLACIAKGGLKARLVETGDRGKLLLIVSYRRIAANDASQIRITRIGASGLSEVELKQKLMGKDFALTDLGAEQSFILNRESDDAVTVVLGTDNPNAAGARCEAPAIPAPLPPAKKGFLAALDSSIILDATGTDGASTIVNFRKSDAFPNDCFDGVNFLPPETAMFKVNASITLSGLPRDGKTKCGLKLIATHNGRNIDKSQDLRRPDVFVRPDGTATITWDGVSISLSNEDQYHFEVWSNRNEHIGQIDPGSTIEIRKLN